MTPFERAGFIAHSRLPVFERRVDAALRVVADALDLGDSYVAVSWGKDSIALLHLVQSLKPDVPAVCYTDPDEELLDNYSEVAAAYVARFPATVYEPIAAAGDRVPDKARAVAMWLRRPVLFMGLRAEEAAGRRMDMRAHGPIHRYAAGPATGTWRACPLAAWSWRDVWAYLCKHGLPWLASYDDAFAEDRSKSRTCNLVAKGIPYGPKGAEFGRIARIRARCPDYYNMLCRDYPEIARLT